MKFSQFLKESTSNLVNYYSIEISVTHVEVIEEIKTFMKDNKLDDVVIENLKRNGPRGPLCDFKSLDFDRLVTVVRQIEAGGFYSESLSASTANMGIGFELRDLTHLTDVPASIRSHVFCYDQKHASLSDFAKHVKHISGMFILHADNASDIQTKTNLLGLLKIRGLAQVSLGFAPNQERAEKIIEKYLSLARCNDNILNCQHELLDAGLEEQAEL